MLDWGGLATLIQSEDVGSSYVDVAVCGALKTKPLLDKMEQAVSTESLYIRPWGWLAEVTEYSTNIKHNTGFINKSHN
jgi:hypothetical protein